MQRIHCNTYHDWENICKIVTTNQRFLRIRFFTAVYVCRNMFPPAVFFFPCDVERLTSHEVRCALLYPFFEWRRFFVEGVMTIAHHRFVIPTIVRTRLTPTFSNNQQIVANYVTIFTDIHPIMVCVAMVSLHYFAFSTKLCKKLVLAWLISNPVSVLFACPFCNSSDSLSSLPLWPLPWPSHPLRCAPVGTFYLFSNWFLHDCFVSQFFSRTYAYIVVIRSALRMSAAEELAAGAAGPFGFFDPLGLSKVNPLQ